MSYVLSVIHPPVNGAAYGKAVTYPPQDKTELFDQVSAYLEARFGSLGPVNVVGSLAYRLANEPVGTVVCDPATGCDFRIDPADNAPHPCPCDSDDGDGDNPCGRLVLPTDHAYADAEDALCTGCFTWNRGGVQCLPANTAHPAEESS